jgi:16S rRNA (guanine527-N7)-methyltransferase
LEQSVPLRNNLESYLRQLGVKFSETILDQLDIFAGMVLKYNRSLNLVSKKDPEREIVKQIADSSILTIFMTPENNSVLIDVGSGGGIPGIILKIFWPGIKLISLDPKPKKIAFQAEVSRKLMLQNYRFIDSQFQEYTPDAPADIITVKGLGKFKKVLRFAVKALRKNGKLILYLGEELPGELKTVEDTLFDLESDNSYILPDYPGNHHLIKLNKIE